MLAVKLRVLCSRKFFKKFVLAGILILGVMFAVKIPIRRGFELNYILYQ